ncbi:hypothetical protein Scep_004686 [Stephania cephalantha]|uniref:Uncharacterized protein n=1 Tax=Stephania cephalantha TaxID=152367 RepID=A0AAP0KSX9_9MAGN
MQGCGANEQRGGAAAPTSRGAGEQLRRRGSDSGGWPVATAWQRVESAATRRNAEELTSGGGDRRPAALATDERQRGCDAMNGAVTRCRPGWRQGSRPKPEVFPGRPSILSLSMDVS